MMKGIKGKALYTPKGAAREYGRVGCNFYIGCPHDCTYCYLKRGLLSHAMGKTEVTLKKCFKNEEHALDVFGKEAWMHWEQLKETGIFFSFSTDPMVSHTRDLTMLAAKEATRLGIPVKVLTKAADSHKWKTMMSTLPEERRCLIAFGFTLTGCDDMEPGAPTNEERITAMQKMHEAGFRTFASIEPVIEIDKSLRMIDRTMDFCDLYLIGLRSGVKANCYKPTDITLLYHEVMALHAQGRRDFKVYWKKSFRKYMKKNGHEIADKPYFVENDYNMFNE